MKRFFVNTTFFVAVMLSASIYAPLQAMEDSTVVIPKTTTRPFWMWQFMGRYQPFGNESTASFNTFLGENLRGTAPNFGNITNAFVLAPFNVSWNHNRWIFYVGLAQFATSSASSDYSASIGSTDFCYGVGYALINTSRFRLYPMLGNYGTIDIVSITRKQSLQSLLSSFNDQTIRFNRFGGLLELAVGADYSFPMEYGDLYIIAKAGYNWEPGAIWYVNQVYEGPMAGSNPNWFSRRGVFFQIGIGFGSERQ